MAETLSEKNARLAGNDSIQEVAKSIGILGITLTYLMDEVLELRQEVEQLKKTHPSTGVDITRGMPHG